MILKQISSLQYETRKGDEVVLAGANASAEEADEGTDEGSTSGVDIVLNHRYFWISHEICQA